jgi:hypothetical protein
MVMSVRIMALVWSTQFPDFVLDEKTIKASTVKFVTLALADHANDDGEGIYPSLSLIERKCELTRPTVVDAIKALRHYQILLYEGESKRGTNQYSLNLNHFGDGKLALLVKLLNQTSKASLPEVVKPVYQASKDALPEPSVNHPETTQNNTLFQAKKILFEALKDYPLLLSHIPAYANYEAIIDEEDGLCGITVSKIGKNNAEFLTDRAIQIAERALIGITGNPVAVTFME